MGLGEIRLGEMGLGEMGQNPFEFHGEVKRQETKVMGLLRGEGCVILTSAVFD